MNISMIIKKPIVTEKSMGVPGRYAFEVDGRATKPQVREAVESQFGVKVVRVNTSVRKGGTRRMLRSRQTRWIPATKKAVVTLKQGQAIKELEMKDEE